MSFRQEDIKVAIQRSFYYVPPGLEKSIVESEEELRAVLKPLFPGKRIERETKESSGFDRGQFDIFYLVNGKGKRKENVAYECPDCRKIIIGPPHITPYNDIRCLSGSKGIRFNCGNCNTRLYDLVEAIS